LLSLCLPPCTPLYHLPLYVSGHLSACLSVCLLTCLAASSTPSASLPRVSIYQSASLRHYLPVCMFASLLLFLSPITLSISISGSLLSCLY
jgi:hypothetical protein